MSFAHLHTHTSYSLLDGEGTISKILDRAKELGQNSMAITDHGNMYGVIEFYEYAKKIGIKPVLGCEVYVAARTRFDKIHEYDAVSSHLILLAENNEGYKNLMKIVSSGFTEGFYYKPRVDMDILRKYHGGIIALSGCMFGVLSRKILGGNVQGARESLEEFLDIFGGENYFIEIQDHGLYDQKRLNSQLVSLAREYGVKVAATNDIHYVKKSDARNQDILMCIQMGKSVNDTDRMKMESEELYVKSEEEMRELFSYIPEALENTRLIAERCNVDIEFGKLHLPKFDLPAGRTAFEYLTELCEKGFKKRYGEGEEKRKRLSYELETIRSMGYVDYFLIVWDFVNFAKSNGIPVGPGRGSAAGSIVSYCLEITDIDPIKYDLIFERFLNPERVTMPDIDIDFCYERRGEVIDYVNRKYGSDRVAQIVTFGTMAARLAVRDVARALDVPYSMADKIAKEIPHELNITIKSALEMSRELKNIYDSDPVAKRVIDTASELEGLPRHTSTHAAGVVITNEPVVNYVPLQTNDNIITTQFTMTTIERLGLLKMDFLGLRTLTVIKDALDNIRLSTGKNIDLSGLKPDDPNVYKMISEGDTDGVFQLESAGMKEFMKELAPENIEDIIAGISLYRPGPMDSIPRYVANKKNPGNVSYKHPKLEKILNVTYGCIVYQEQVMEIVRELGGYSLGRADLVRRAMSKKKTEVMKKEKHNFIYGITDENGNVTVEGAVRRGVGEAVAESIFDEMMDFAKYAFNKSHAAAYAFVSYQTAWLKCHYPTEFFAALLTSVIDRKEQITKYIGSMKKKGIKILPPDVNSSFSGFVPDGENIRFGMAAIKNVGGSFIADLAKEREKFGKFKSFTDFCSRMAAYKINKRLLEALIKSGAFDSLGHTRATLLFVYESILESAVKDEKNNISGQYDIFSLFGEEQESGADDFEEIAEENKSDLLRNEKEYLGIYVSGHPLDDVEEIIEENSSCLALELAESAGKTVFSGNAVKLCGIISSIKKKLTKKSETMCYAELEDMTGSVELIIFPSQMRQNESLLFEGSVCEVSGKLDINDDLTVKIVVDKIEKLEKKPKEKKQTKVYIRIPEKGGMKFDPEKQLEVAEGDVPVYVFYEGAKKTLLAPEKYWTFNREECLKKLRKTFGNENVRIV